jgi:hypothetical protein
MSSGGPSEPATQSLRRLGKGASDIGSFAETEHPICMSPWPPTAVWFHQISRDARLLTPVS